MTNEYWDDNDGQDAVNVYDFDNCSVRLTQMPKHMGQHQRKQRLHPPVIDLYNAFTGGLFGWASQVRWLLPVFREQRAHSDQKPHVSWVFVRILLHRSLWD